MNVDNNPDIDYLSEGITESIINILSRIPKLRVMARSTVFRYKGREVDPQEVGALLKVRTVVLGRILKHGERLIIRTEMVDVPYGSQIWGEQYNSSPSDLLRVQEEIATAISERLKAKLTGPAKSLIKRLYTENIEAFNLYLKGRYFWNKYTKDWVLKSIEAFQQAIKLDANFALAYAGMADAYFRLSNVYLPPHEVLPKAKEAAMKAVEIDDELAEAHASLGLIKVYKDHDWAGAESEFKRALELNPDLVLVHQRFGSYLKFMGRFEESMAHYRHALELDPFSLQINMNLATNHYLKGDYDEAIQHLKLTLELEPNYVPTHYALGCAYIQQGRFDEAIEEFQLIYRTEEEAYLALGFMGYAYACNGQRCEAENLLNVLKEIATRDYVSPYSMMVINIGLGKKQQVLDLLDKLYEEGNDWLVWLKVAPELQSLHSEPRYQALLKRIGFSPEPPPPLMTRPNNGMRHAAIIG
jgi:TolB-like protein/Tfp pilus assembly protein PilF